MRILIERLPWRNPSLRSAWGNPSRLVTLSPGIRVHDRSAREGQSIRFSGEMANLCIYIVQLSLLPERNEQAEFEAQSRDRA
jgi:hypothetical protein